MAGVFARLNSRLSILTKRQVGVDLAKKISVTLRHCEIGEDDVTHPPTSKTLASASLPASSQARVVPQPWPQLQASMLQRM
jgi:hypothetical protein